ncbi:transposase, IS885 [Thiorhodococcus drewsii AZ1]|uniref:Transposase, IS885 n=1 Tax=Thiorhodococcus drewsii AZ1 TaxID=765913 RepID=G2E8B9_9GAMM|nr:transposase [Thiorhodococcus drewsii]EGV27658.1 transposase, IS885 [Thiorhodococcus drewsii AZ1]
MAYPPLSSVILVVTSRQDTPSLLGRLYTRNQHLHKLNLTYQKPVLIPREQDPAAVEHFVNEEFPKIQRFANKIQADIGFEDEAGIDLRERSGKTWSARSVRPEVFVTGKRGRLNVLSVITAQGELRYHVTEKSIASKEHVHFLRQLMEKRTRPLIWIVDRAPFHRSRMVREFVCKHRHQIRLHYTELIPIFRFLLADNGEVFRQQRS